MTNFPEEEEFSDADKPIHATPFSQEELNIFQKFKTFARQLFFYGETSKTDLRLKGRIQALEQTANQVVSDLKAIKEDLENHADPDLVGTIETVVNQMIRDVTRIKRKTDSPKSVEEQIDTAERYTKWIERAKPWVHLFNNNLSDRTSIIQAVVKHTIHSSEEIIKRDLQVIKDYQEHKLVEITKDDQTREQLQRKLEAAITRPVENLTQLLHNNAKESSLNDLVDLESWKQEVDSLRKRFYNSSMNTIDSIFHDVHPAVESQEAHDRVLSNLNRIALLEDSVLHIQESLQSRVYEDEDDIRCQVEKHEKEVLSLAQELEHTPEIGDRLNSVQISLIYFRKTLGKFDFE